MAAKATAPKPVVEAPAPAPPPAPPAAPKSPWKSTNGEPLKFELVSRLEHSETGFVREVRRLDVPGGWVYHFTQFGDKQRSESACFVPKVWES